MLILNADDVGRCVAETDIAVRLFREKRLSSGTFMMFMEDTERAVDLAQEYGMSAGLHLNLSQRYTGRCPSPAAGAAHERVVRFMRSSKFAVLVYHPGLRNAFREVIRSQTDEYARLFGRLPRHLDGHQHRHLCANVLWDQLIPEGWAVRRNFSFFPGQKAWVNRTYRRWMDGRLQRRHRLADYFFSLEQCLEQDRLALPAQLAKTHPVEMMTHPVRDREASFLSGDGFVRQLGDVPLGNYDSV